MKKRKLRKWVKTTAFAILMLFVFIGNNIVQLNFIKNDLNEMNNEMNNEINNKIQVLENEIDKLHKILIEKNIQLEDGQKRLEESEKANNELQNENNLKSEEINNLNNMVNELQNENEELKEKMNVNSSLREVIQTDENVRDSYNGAILTPSAGTIMGPSGKETYYNLNMSGVISIMQGAGYNYEYWVREDGVKMYGDYVMAACGFDVRPRGTLVETSLGTAICADTGGFAEENPYQIDIAVNW